MTAINTINTVAATAATSSLRVTDAHLHFFSSKDEYLAFNAAWKALANSGDKLSSSMFAAHAILHGRDLYKTFSPNRRKHQGDTPYLAVAEALSTVPYLASFLTRQTLALSDAQKAALVDGFTKAGDFVKAQGLSSYSKHKALVMGAAEFAPAESAVARTVEA